MRCDAKGNGERWQEALPLWRTYLQRSLQRFGKHGISMSCYSRLDFSRDFHKSNFRETGKLWLLSMRTDRYVMWYGAIIAATGYIFCYYYYCCCRRRRHRRRYCYNCCCFSCSISRKKNEALDSMQLFEIYGQCTMHSCTIVQFHLKFKSKWKQVVWFDFNNKFHLKCRKCIANTLYFST